MPYFKLFLNSVSVGPHAGSAAERLTTLPSLIREGVSKRVRDREREGEKARGRERERERNSAVAVVENTHVWRSGCCLASGCFCLLATTIDLERMHFLLAKERKLTFKQLIRVARSNG